MFQRFIQFDSRFVIPIILKDFLIFGYNQIKFINVKHFQAQIYYKSQDFAFKYKYLSNEQIYLQNYLDRILDHLPLQIPVLKYKFYLQSQ